MARFLPMEGPRVGLLRETFSRFSKLSELVATTVQESQPSDFSRWQWLSWFCWFAECKMNGDTETSAKGPEESLECAGLNSLPRRLGQALHPTLGGKLNAGTLP